MTLSPTFLPNLRQQNSPKNAKATAMGGYANESTPNLELNFLGWFSLFFNGIMTPVAMMLNKMAPTNRGMSATDPNKTILDHGVRSVIK